MKNIERTISNIVVSIVIVFSLIVIFSSLDIFGHRMYAVKSGSMEPKIPTGSLVFDEKSSGYKVGDVITFRIPNNKDTVTHRIVQIKTDLKNDTFYVVKGDANQASDPNPVPKDDVVGKVSHSVPYFGYLVSFVKTLPGLIIFIIIPATIIIYQELVNIKTEIAKIRATKRKVVEEVEKIEDVVEKEEKKIIREIKGASKRKGAKNHAP